MKYRWPTVSSSRSSGHDPGRDGQSNEVDYGIIVAQQGLWGETTPQEDATGNGGNGLGFEKPSGDDFWGEECMKLLWVVCEGIRGNRTKKEYDMDKGI